MPKLPSSSQITAKASHGETSYISHSITANDSFEQLSRRKTSQAAQTIITERLPSGEALEDNGEIDPSAQRLKSTPPIGSRHVGHLTLNLETPCT
jgi:hypothetical protein